MDAIALDLARVGARTAPSRASANNGTSFEDFLSRADTKMDAAATDEPRRADGPRSRSRSESTADTPPRDEKADDPVISDPTAAAAAETPVPTDPSQRTGAVGASTVNGAGAAATPANGQTAMPGAATPDPLGATTSAGNGVASPAGSSTEAPLAMASNAAASAGMDVSANPSMTGEPQPTAPAAEPGSAASDLAPELIAEAQQSSEQLTARDVSAAAAQNASDQAGNGSTGDSPTRLLQKDRSHQGAALDGTDPATTQAGRTGDPAPTGATRTGAAPSGGAPAGTASAAPSTDGGTSGQSFDQVLDQTLAHSATGSHITSSPSADNVTAAAGAHRPAAVPQPVADQIAVQIHRGVQQGTDRITIQLSPAELGRIDVQLDVGQDGRVNATIAVERPETLDLLQRDARSLERALQDAGLKADSGGLSFNLRGDGRQNMGSGSMAHQNGFPAGRGELGGSDITTATDAAQPRARANGAIDIRV